MSLLSTGLEYLSTQRKAYMAETGTIRRATDETPDVSMTVGKTSADVDGGNGITVRTDIVDFLIHAADYQIDSAAVEPKRGDEIDYAGETYRVLPIAGGEVWRYAERINKTTLRIHTKLKGDAS